MRSSIGCPLQARSHGGWAARVRGAEALPLVLAELQVATVRHSPPYR
ncbi:hypothetical protein [Actinacidiphila sp. bgisy167]